VAWREPGFKRPWSRGNPTSPAGSPPSHFPGVDCVDIDSLFSEDELMVRPASTTSRTA